jgi:hypothetical protein
MDGSVPALKLELAARPTGSAVAFTFTLHNPGPAPAELYLRGREPVLDVTIRDPEGELIWQRLAGAMIPAIIRLEQLAAGADLVVSCRWDGFRQDGVRAVPGEYEATGALLTDGAPLVAPAVRFSLS